MLGTPTLPNSAVEKVIAGSDANAYVKQLALGPNGGGVCTGTNDDVIIQAALSAMPATGSVLKMVGTFVPSQMMRNSISHCVIDATNATFSLPTSWAPSGRALFQLGPNHFTDGTFTLPGGSGTAPLFTFTTSAAGQLQGDVVYLQTTGTLPAGYSNSTPYYVVSYTPTGFGTATCQFSLTLGGSAVTATSAGSGTIYLSTASGTWNSGTNVLTILGSSPPQFAKGQPIDISNGASIIASLPLFCSPQGSNTYTLFFDPLLKAQVTSGPGSTTLSVVPYGYGCGMRGGTIIVPSGVGTHVSSAGLVKDNIPNYRGFIDGITTLVDPSVGSSLSINGAHIYSAGYGTRVVNNSLNSGLLVGIFAEGVGGDISDNNINGMNLGIRAVGATAYIVGSTIARNQIRYCVTNAIQVQGTGILVYGNYCDQNCNNISAVSGTANAEIVDTGNGSQIGFNGFNLLPGVNNYSLNGTTILQPFPAIRVTSVAQIAPLTVINFTPPTDTPPQTYVLTGSLNISSTDTLATISVLLGYTDQNGNAQTVTIPEISAAGTTYAAGTTNLTGQFNIPAFRFVAKTNNEIDVAVQIANDSGGSSYIPSMQLDRVG